MRDDITNIAIDDYLLDSHATALRNLPRNSKSARMIMALPLIGPVQGQFLYLLAKSMDAREALEIGTVTGYAADVADARSGVGRRPAHRDRANSERFELAKDYLTRAGYADQLVIHQGEWFSVLESIDGRIRPDLPRHPAQPVRRARCGQGARSMRVAAAARRHADRRQCAVQRAGGRRGRGADCTWHPRIQPRDHAAPDSSNSSIIPLRDGVAICRKKD